MNRIAKIFGAASVTATAFALVACSTSTTGNGTQNGSLSAASVASDTVAVSSSSAVVSDSDTPVLPPSSVVLTDGASTTPTTATATKTSTATVTHTTSHPTTSSASHATSSSAPPLPYILNAEGAPDCTNRTNQNGHVKITYTSKYGTEVWIVATGIVEPGVDPKTSGGVGPLPANGSKTLPYDCRNGDNAYNVYTYNSTGKGGEAINVDNPAPA